MAKRANITEDKILTNYEEALQLARAQQKPDSMVNAATAQAKLVGLLKDRIETKDVTDFDSMGTPSEVLEAVAAKRIERCDRCPPGRRQKQESVIKRRTAGGGFLLHVLFRRHDRGIHKARHNSSGASAAATVRSTC